MKKNLQKGSAHLIVVLVLVLALVGSLGFVFYQNFIENKNDTSKIVKKDTEEIVTPAVEPAAVVRDLLTAYLSYMSSAHTTSFSSNLLTDKFQTVVDNPSGKIIMVDPILLVQNMPGGFTVGSATVSGESASVPVTLNFAEPYDITYGLIIVNNEWKVDGVAGRFKN